MNINMQELEQVRILAKEEAQRKKKDQVIINSYEGKYKVFRFFDKDGWDGQIVATVRYTPEDKRADVLRDNGNGKPGTVKGKSKGKGKPRKAE